MVSLKAFKSYDVRGVYPSDINEEVASLTAKAFAFYLKADKLVIGRDGRESSPSLYASVVEALMELGIDVYDLGLCTTPLLNYAVAAKNFPGGIMITASHNPKEYNALKLVRDAIQFSSPGELDLVKKLVEDPSGIKPWKQGRGRKVTLDVLKDYVSEIVEHFEKVKGLKIIVDCANGMGAITARPVFESLGLDFRFLNEEVNFNTPHHQANPAEEHNLEQLRAAVIEEKADCGVFFDGDADRSLLIDEKGDVVFADILTSILVPHELNGRVDKRVYYDLRFSKVVKEVIGANRGTPVMMRVGNPFYKEKLKNEGGVFAAELSGHMMFQDHYAIDDGLYAALKGLKAMVVEGKKLSELAKSFQKYFTTPEMNYHVKDADEVLSRVADAFKDGKSLELDGVFVSYDDWWFNLRKSNTEPVVRLRIEADSKEKLDAMLKKIEGILKA
ncbi:phosphomannomutase/phosphoglucomutase [Candidatus Woesearchaeota archaeon]|nr:phosphomannomutase/phosphoglucomutase [Candidatus Woesearchaeota archaeon]